MAKKLSIAEKYIHDVTNGNIVVNDYVRLAVERHLKDLTDGINRGLHFDRKAAERAIKFYSFLRHGKLKKFAGKPFEPSPWQAFIDWVVYGWKNSNGFRRFNIAYVQVPRKNGKTVKIAKDGLYLAFKDGEIGSEVYAVANKEDQARLALGEAWNIVKNSPQVHYYDPAKMDERLENYGGKKNIKLIKSIIEPSSSSFFQSLGSDSRTQDGLNPHGAIIDEYHEHVTDDMVNVITSGTGAQDEWLMWIITTAGFNISGPCFEERETCIKILQGIIEQDNKFAYICEPDEGDDWENEEVWAKVNPNWGVSVNPAEVKKAYIDAKNKPSRINNFKTKYLNIWTSTHDVWIKDEDYQACNFGLKLEDLYGRPCHGAFDLASHVDINVFSLFFTDKKPYDIWRFAWCPEDKVLDRKERVPYDLWVEQGWLKATPGNVTDIDIMTDDIINILEKVDCISIGYDPARAFHGVIQNLLKRTEVQLNEFKQRTVTFDTPVREYEKLVLSKNLNHGGNPLLRWMCSNVVIFSDTSGNVKLDKKRSAEKIDGMVSDVMAIGEWLTPNDTPDLNKILNERLNAKQSLL